MRIATWNINSVRLRLNLIRRFLEEAAPDVLCLQEIKCPDAKFPAEPLAELGWPYQLVHGQKNYHGVAIVSRLPLEGHAIHAWCGIDESRHQATRLPGGIELHNLYIPSGGDEPDPQRNPKFRHKLEFLGELGAWWRGARSPGDRLVAVGDFNVAPLESDVWSHRQMLKVVSHTPVEVESLDRLQASLGWIDAVRRMIPPEEKLYSWWSYRARDWSASDRGRRLDHIWVSEPLASRVRAATVLRAARGWRRPSDHVPVWVDMDL